MSDFQIELDKIKIVESRRLDVIKYVLDHPNCTKADVIRYMKGKSAVRTTHGILVKLINEGKINMQKKHIQTHLLTVNRDNDFIKHYIQIEQLENFTNEARQYIQYFYYANYKTRPPLKYEGIDGFENSFRQLFNIIPQILYHPSTHVNLDITPADWRILDNKIKYVFFNLAFYNWDKHTTREVIERSCKNIEVFFQTLNKEKNKLIKMMERDQIDKLDNEIEFGKKLIEIINKFKKEHSSYLDSHEK